MPLQDEAAFARPYLIGGNRLRRFPIGEIQPEAFVDMLRQRIRDRLGGVAALQHDDAELGQLRQTVLGAHCPHTVRQHGQR
jgi:hypothetical protein